MILQLFYKDIILNLLHLYEVTPQKFTLDNVEEANLSLDTVKMKSRLKTKNTLQFDRKTMFNTSLELFFRCDFKPKTDKISQKQKLTTRIDETHLKSDSIPGSNSNGITGPGNFSLVLDKHPEGFVTQKEQILKS